MTVRLTIPNVRCACGVALTPNRGGPPRKWCSERCRKRHLYGGTCQMCGAPTNASVGKGKAPALCYRCAPASPERREKLSAARRDDGQRAELVRRWNAGESIPQIMAAMGLSKGALSSKLARLRAQGYDLPYRYRTYKGQVLRAVRRERSA